MKKWIALLLVLLLLLSAACLGEEERRIVEFDDFCIAVSDRDLLQLEEETGSTSLFRLFPDYDAATVSHPNIIAAWAPGILGDLSDEEVLVFCNSIMQVGIQSLTAEGVAVTNEQLLRAEQDAKTSAITVLFTLDADVTALGLDMRMTVCMGCRYIPFGEKGCCSFTLGCETVEEAEMLIAYMDKNLTIKQ